eukprot:216025_1
MTVYKDGDSTVHFICQCVSICITLASLISLFRIIQSRSQINRPSSNASYLYKLTTAVVVINLVYSILDLIGARSCFQCNVMVPIKANMYGLSKMTNYLSFLHRAKLSQTVDPMLSIQCFTRVFPGVIIAVCILFLTFMDVSLIIGDSHVGCASWKDAHNVHLCWSPDPGDIYWIGVVIDVTMTVILLALFVKPLVNNLQRDLGHLNRGQLEKRQNLIDLLKLYVLLTFINLVSQWGQQIFQLLACFMLHMFRFSVMVSPWILQLSLSPLS